MADLELFVLQSNWIEGIRRDPTVAEVKAHEAFLAEQLTIESLRALVKVLQPDAVLRDRAGLNVYVGQHVPPKGGAHIVSALERILEQVRQYPSSAFHRHQAYEALHPFTDGNGRSGRALWLYMMGGVEKAPLGFLHHWYYQSLQHWPDR